jgi:hypothetical protein
MICGPTVTLGVIFGPRFTDVPIKRPRTVPAGRGRPLLIHPAVDPGIHPAMDAHPNRTT